MYSGAGYVIAAYAFMAVMLVIWFAMIVRRYSATSHELEDVSTHE